MLKGVVRSGQAVLVQLDEDGLCRFIFEPSAFHVGVLPDYFTEA